MTLMTPITWFIWVGFVVAPYAILFFGQDRDIRIRALLHCHGSASRGHAEHQ
jgi:hypothetical protein